MNDASAAVPAARVLAYGAAALLVDVGDATAVAHLTRAIAATQQRQLR